MYLTEDVRFPSLSPFRIAGKRSPAKNLDQVSRRFDEALLNRLNPLLTNPSSSVLLSFDWLSLAVDLLSKTHSDAHNIVSDLRYSSSSSSFSYSSSGFDDPIGLYLDDSLKLLDLCNSIVYEIERLRHSRLLIQFVLHLLSSEIPSAEKLVRAKKSLLEWNAPSTVSKNRNLAIPTDLIRDLASRLEDPPHGKISTVGKLVHRTIYAVEAVAVFVAGVVVASLTGATPALTVKVPSEFAWAEAFNGLALAVSGEFSKRFPGEERRFVGDLARLELRVKSVCEIMDNVNVTAGDGVVIVSKTERVNNLDTEVTELKTVMEKFSDGLDRLLNGVNELFHAVLWTRNGVLEKYWMGPLKKSGKLSCK